MHPPTTFWGFVSSHATPGIVTLAILVFISGTVLLAWFLSWIGRPKPSFQDTLAELELTTPRLAALANSIVGRVHEDMQQWNFGGEVVMTECPVESFLIWYRWRTHTSPMETLHSGQQIPLSSFDVESCVNLMAEWIKQPFNP